MRLLLVEDDLRLAESLTAALRRSGHAVDCVHRGAQALSMLGAEPYDLAVLDLGLPDVDGISLLRSLRSRGNPIPVLILTARDAVSQGLDGGADDYMLKPFEFSELESRIRAVTRRSGAGAGANLVAGQLELDIAGKRARCAGRPVELSPREFGVLEILMQRQGRVVSKAQIRSRLCTWNDDLTEGAIEICVHRLRRKLEDCNVEIRTARGFGYLFDVKSNG